MDAFANTPSIANLVVTRSQSSVSIDSMQDGNIQGELLKETRATIKALEIAIKINIEISIQNHLKTSGTSAYSLSNQIANALSTAFKNHGTKKNNQR